MILSSSRAHRTSANVIRKSRTNKRTLNRRRNIDTVAITSSSSANEVVFPVIGDIAKKAAAIATKSSTAATTKSSLCSCLTVGTSLATMLNSQSALAFPIFALASTVPVTLAYINPVYSFSVGYGLSVAASSLLLLLSAQSQGIVLTQFCQLHIVGGLIYGLRLGIFLAIRSKTWKDWGKRAKASPEAQNSKTFVQKTTVILGCGFIYALMSAPMLFHYQSANIVHNHVIIKAGLALQWFGLILEAVADQWKYAHYQKNEGKFCMTGPYAYVRHPNYLGEMMFWGGLYVAGIPAMMAKLSTFIPSTIGFAFIMFLMTMASKRGDKNAREKYQNSPGYAEYRAKSCSLVPGF
jgi:steroid 5-alpha reductase family enzyme